MCGGTAEFLPIIVVASLDLLELAAKCHEQYQKFILNNSSYMYNRHIKLRICRFRNAA